MWCAMEKKRLIGLGALAVYWVIPLSLTCTTTSRYACPANYNLRQNSSFCYLLVDKEDIYWRANKYCHSLGGVLVTIKDKSIQIYLATLAAVAFNLSETDKAKQGKRLWIGLSDRVFRNKFRWTNCNDGWLNENSYQDWESEDELKWKRKPNGRCVFLKTFMDKNKPSSVWSLSDCGKANSFICQTDAFENITATTDNCETTTHTGNKTFDITNGYREQETHDTNSAGKVKMSKTAGPLLAILIIILVLLVVSMILGIWYRKRNRENQQQVLMQESGMPRLPHMPMPSRQYYFSRADMQSAFPHFSNNSNNIDPYGRNVYSGQDIIVIDEDGYMESSVISELSVHSCPHIREVIPGMVKTASQFLTPVEQFRDDQE